MHLVNTKKKMMERETGSSSGNSNKNTNNSINSNNGAHRYGRADDSPYTHATPSHGPCFFSPSSPPSPRLPSFPFGLLLSRSKPLPYVRPFVRERERKRKKEGRWERLTRKRNGAPRTVAERRTTATKIPFLNCIHKRARPPHTHTHTRTLSLSPFLG